MLITCHINNDNYCGTFEYEAVTEMCAISIVIVMVHKKAQHKFHRNKISTLFKDPWLKSLFQNNILSKLIKILEFGFFYSV